MNKFIIITILALSAFTSSCSNFEELNTDPNAATKVNASMLATSSILNITRQGGNKYFLWYAMISKHISWWEGALEEQYNRFGRTSFGTYSSLIDGLKMIEVAEEKDKDVYTALFKFLKAYKLFYLSLEVGDIPYSEALKGETENIITPKYDTQKDVMLQVLGDLEEAYELFGTSKHFDGDPIFNGDTQKWRKAAVAMQLKVLIHLSKKADDSDLKVKERFNKLLSSGALMESNDDNLQLVYANAAGQVYPLHYTQTNHAGYGMVSNLVIDNMKKFEDYRMFYYCSPAKYQLNKGVSASEWDAYMSVDPSDFFPNIATMASEGKYCAFNARYTQRPEGEPLIRLGYAEQNFILAEAALRGWINKDASVYYKKAIKGSMNFVAKYTPNEAIYNHGRLITDEYIDKYINSDVIQLKGGFEEQLEQIMLQRYLASFIQHPYDSYYDYRRTGYPILPINPETNMNTEKDKIPMRWMYPDSEFSFNADNANAAVERQYGGSDNVNKLMWILQD